MSNCNERNQCNIRAAFPVIFATISILMFILTGCTKEKPSSVIETKGIGCIFFDKLPPEITNPLDINFENRVKLLGVTINKKSYEQFEISYYWQMMSDLGKFKKVFVHFADSGNNVLFQNDHEFCPKRPFEEFKGKVIKETFLVFIPHSARGQEINVKLGVYVPEQDGPRLKILSAGNMQLEDKNTSVSVEKVNL